MKAEIIQKAELLLNSIKTRSFSDKTQLIELNLLMNQMAELYLELLEEQSKLISGSHSGDYMASIDTATAFPNNNPQRPESHLHSEPGYSAAAEAEEDADQLSPAQSDSEPIRDIIEVVEQKSEAISLDKDVFPLSEAPEPGPAADKFPESEPLKTAAATINEQFKSEGNTINQKLAQTTSDLNSSVPRKTLSCLIDLNTALQFKKGLFGGQEELFNQTVKYLSSVKDEDVAKSFVTDKLAPKLKWDPQNEQVINFMELLDKSFGK